MSFLSDLLEGNTGNLWTDIEHAPSSLAAHPEQIAELAAGAGAVALPFLAPEILGALGLGDITAAAGDLGVGAAASDVGAAAPAVEAGLEAGAPADALAAAAEPAAAAGLPAWLSDAVNAGGLGSLGETVGGVNAPFIPTTVDTAAVDLGAGAGANVAGVSGVPSIAAATTPVATPTAAQAAGEGNILAFTGAGDQAPAQAAITDALTGPSTSAYAANAAPLSGDAVPYISNADIGGQLAAETGGGAAPILSNPVVADVGPTVGGAALGGATDVGSTAPSAAASIGGASSSGAAPTSIWDALSGAGGGLGKLASNPLLQLAVPGGMLAYDLMKGPAPIPSAATAATQNAISQLGPLQGKAQQNVDLYNTTAATDLNLANNFQISPAQAASIDQWKQGQMNQLYQQIANQGNTNPTSSSEFLQGKNQIDQQALAMQVQMVNQLISTAFQASTAANAGVSTATNVTSSIDNLLMQTAQLQVQQDTSFNQAVGSAMQAFGLVAGLNAGNFNKLGSQTAGNSLT